MYMYLLFMNFEKNDNLVYVISGNEWNLIFFLCVCRTLI